MKTNHKPRYAVVDLEATGTSITAKIIQVGIVIIEDNRIIDTYATDINPHEPLTEHIKSLTGISDEQLEKAPDFSQVAGTIYRLLEGCIFVAHNVKFDANLLAEELFFEGYDLHTPRVDTVELAQVFFPTLEKYNLTALADALGIPLSDAHTAIADAMATAELFLRLLDKISSLPKITLEKLLELSDALLFETGMVIEQCFSMTNNAHLPDHYLEQSGIVVKKSLPIPSRRKLSKSFETNLALLGLNPRPQQEIFAQAITDGLQDTIPSFIQAPAGIGKTLGYLLPLLAHHPNEQLVVSVPTKILQDQLLAKEGKWLTEMFHIRLTNLKSSRHYISLEAFDATWRRQDNRLVNRYKLQVLVWLLETTTGDLDEIRQKQRFEAYFDDIRHSGKTYPNSSFQHMDFWLRLQEVAKQSDVLVTNHAYLLARNEGDPTFLTGKILVIDEVQKFFLTLEASSHASILLKDFQDLITEQLAQVSNQLHKRLLESLSFTSEHLLKRLGKQNQLLLSHEDITPLKRDLEELDSPHFLPLQEVFAPSFSQYWLEKTDEGIRLAAARMSVMRVLEILPPLKKWYGISATLDISQTVTLPFLLGITDYTKTILPAPQNQQQLVAIPNDLPAVKTLSEQTYSNWLANTLADLFPLKHPIVVLFTSKATMLKVSDCLEELGIKHVTQDKNGSASTVKRRFDRGEVRLLLGTGAFWEGVDFAEPDRLLVVITRLPFENPNFPHAQKMAHYLRDLGKDPFLDYSLPVMWLKLSQALGRGRRRSQQRSVLLLLDNRVLTSNYGSLIQEALAKEAPVISQNFSEIVTGISDFLV